MSVLSGIFSLGYIVGVQLGSRLDSYLLVFGLAAALGFLGVGYALFVLEESLNKDDKAGGHFIITITILFYLHKAKGI